MAEDKNEHGGGHGGEEHEASHPPHEEHEEHEGVPEWMVSFADNTALMMGFFVILLAFAMAKAGNGASGTSSSASASAGTGQPAGDMVDFAIAVRNAFNNPPDINNPRDAILIQRLRDRQRPAGEDEGAEGSRQRTQLLQRGDKHGVAAAITFDLNQAKLDESARRDLKAYADHVRGLKVVTELRAHVSFDESYNRSDNGVRLSFDRAMVVAEALKEMGIEWKAIRLAPCGGAESVRQRAYTREERDTNRRVEVILTKELAGE